MLQGHEHRSTYKSAEEDVDDANEDLRKNHAFPEIHWATHFREEGDEKNATREGIYTSSSVC